MENIQKSSIDEILEKEHFQKSTKSINSSNCNQSDCDEQSKNEMSFYSRIKKGLSMNNKSRSTVFTVQQIKIIELQNVESCLDKDLSVTTKVIKELFLQFTALQRHALRRHLRACRNMLKDLGDLVEFLNEETILPRSDIEEDIQLWTQELEKTYQRIDNLKEYFLKVINRARFSDYSEITNMPLFSDGLNNTKSILHRNFEQIYGYLSDVYTKQRFSITSLEDVIHQHKVTSNLISKISQTLPASSNFILNLGTENTCRLITPYIRDAVGRPDNFAILSTTTPDLSVLPEENQTSHQSDQDV